MSKMHQDGCLATKFPGGARDCGAKTPLPAPSCVASHGFNRSWQREISAVGATVESAISALCAGCNLGELDRIEYQKHNGAPCEWFVRFTADGTSMKAAGEYVRGGVIVTWWK